ncbi:hypothetical protein [Bifidobacterium pseudolongum]|uniref:hypothetical protein n=1 Tax=Bifidobacterium pseudolongum TaxID=1694 RepID=UPI001EE63FD4|nr:hypothetical protein [Bifidobacterium pseudolongum]UNP91153.1 hypothetical protein MPY69_06900 [Bifidobacterium pseudolongum subsp. pseudolongum]WCA41137.1 hypothetical protein PGB23_01525 [Bifidobacterium pseudolongum subsp. pseudolongum]
MGDVHGLPGFMGDLRKRITRIGQCLGISGREFRKHGNRIVFVGLHLLRLLAQLESHHSRDGQYEHDNGEDTHNPRPHTAAVMVAMATVVLLLRVRLRHAAP